jgi:hypothetical protein
MEYKRKARERLMKVNIEFTLVAIAHNIRKWTKKAGLFWFLIKIIRFHSKKRKKQNPSDIKSIILITELLHKKKNHFKKATLFA